jgi:ABC-type multidrug transport system, ATPase component
MASVTSAPAGPAPLIEATDLVKRYGDLTAVNGVDFTVQPRDFLGFLGPNGAGKTTIMKMIYCLVEPTSGCLRVFDTDVRADPRRIKSRLGVVPQENNLDPDLTVWDNLLIYCRYFGLRGPEVEARARELLDFMELWDRRDTVIGKLSGGMKRRLVIARALLNEPDW